MTNYDETSPPIEAPSKTNPDTSLSHLEQKVRQLEETLEARNDELATAEAQRDEVNLRLCETENHMAVERVLHQAGVVDVETATLLLSRRVDLSESVTIEELTAVAEQLLQEKPFLRPAPSAQMPPATRTVRDETQSTLARVADMAQRAASSGSRRDVAEYLRLRRASMK